MEQKCVPHMEQKCAVLARVAGIEDPGQLVTLQELGCDLAQGYLFSRPLTATELTAQLRRHWPNPLMHRHDQPLAAPER